MSRHALSFDEPQYDGPMSLERQLQSGASPIQEPWLASTLRCPSQIQKLKTLGPIFEIDTRNLDRTLNRFALTFSKNESCCLLSAEDMIWVRLAEVSCHVRMPLYISEALTDLGVDPLQSRGHRHHTWVISQQYVYAVSL